MIRDRPPTRCSRHTPRNEGLFDGILDPDHEQRRPVWHRDVMKRKRQQVYLLTNTAGTSVEVGAVSEIDPGVPSPSCWWLSFIPRGRGLVAFRSKLFEANGSAARMDCALPASLPLDGSPNALLGALEPALALVIKLDRIPSTIPLRTFFFAISFLRSVRAPSDTPPAAEKRVMAD
jgi:hypothetical protein